MRLEWISILYLLSAIVLLYFTLGSSQAMKAAWVEDILGLTPPIAFLVASRVRNRKPNDRFPYGYHRATAIAYLCAVGGPARPGGLHPLRLGEQAAQVRARRRSTWSSRSGTGRSGSGG